MLGFMYLPALLMVLLPSLEERVGRRLRALLARRRA
jgi:hypothetical protein